MSSKVISKLVILGRFDNDFIGLYVARIFYFLVLFSSLFYSNVSFSDVKKQYEESFASSIVLTDSDAIRFGIGDFNPVNILEPLVEQQTETELSLRNRLQVATFPYSWSLDDTAVINVHGAYVEQKQQITFNDISIPDDSKDRLYGGFIGYENRIKQFSQWQLRAGVGVHLLQFNNFHRYNSSFSQSLAKSYNGVYFNTTANALMVELDATLSRKKERKWGFWELKSNYNQFFGRTFSGDPATRGATPIGWHFINSATANIKIDQRVQFTESIYLKFQRVDLGGDARSAFATGHYYEYGGGLLIDTRHLTSWFDNIGIGIHFNEGSAFSGGSIVLYINEL